MISLPALEEPFAKKYPPGDEAARAVEGAKPTPAPHCALHHEEIKLADANGILQQERASAA